MLIISALLLYIVLSPIMVRIPYIGAYKVDYMLPFFLLGIAVTKNSRLITNGRLLGVWTLLFIAGMLVYKADYLWYVNKSDWFPIKEMLSTHKPMLDLSNLFFALMRTWIGAVASLFFISLFYHLEKNPRVARLFGKIDKWGMYTLHVYILQTFLVQINVFGIYLPSDNMFLFNFALAPLVALVMTAASVVLARIMEKSAYINKFLFGKF